MDFEHHVIDSEEKISVLNSLHDLDNTSLYALLQDHVYGVGLSGKEKSMKMTSNPLASYLRFQSSRGTQS